MIKRTHPTKALFGALLLLAFSGVGSTLLGQVLPESVFAVVTHKGGLAARLAHNHLVVAETFAADLTFSPDDLSATTFRFSAKTLDLSIDDTTRIADLGPRIIELGLVDGMAKLSDDQREEIRGKMLDKKQLDAEGYPELSVVLGSVMASDTLIGPQAFTHQAMIQVTIHGTTVERPVAVRYVVEGEILRIEGTGTFHFKDFGIKPFSAFLGSVKVQNEFELYLDLKWALPQPPEEGPIGNGSIGTKEPEHNR